MARSDQERAALRAAEVLIRAGLETRDVAKATGLSPQKVGALRGQIRFGDELKERRRLIAQRHADGSWEFWEALEQAAREMSYALNADVDMPDYEQAFALWLEVGDALWRYGAKRGLDVSEITKLVERMQGGEN